MTKTNEPAPISWEEAKRQFLEQHPCKDVRVVTGVNNVARTSERSPWGTQRDMKYVKCDAHGDRGYGPDKPSAWLSAHSRLGGAEQPNWKEAMNRVIARHPNETLEAKLWRGGYMVCDVSSPGWRAVDGNAVGNTEERAWEVLDEIESDRTPAVPAPPVLSPSGDGGMEICGICGHPEQCHANYSEMPRKCNQTGCGCWAYSTPPAEGSAELIELPPARFTEEERQRANSELTDHGSQYERALRYARERELIAAQSKPVAAEGSLPPCAMTVEEVLEVARNAGNEFLGLDRDQLRILLCEAKNDLVVRERQLRAALTAQPASVVSGDEKRCPVCKGTEDHCLANEYCQSPIFPKPMPVLSGEREPSKRFADAASKILGRVQEYIRDDWKEEVSLDAWLWEELLALENLTGGERGAPKVVVTEEHRKLAEEWLIEMAPFCSLGSMLVRQRATLLATRELLASLAKPEGVK